MKKPFIYNPFSRRMFLQSAGAYLSIPVLSSLLPKNVYAQTSPKRYIRIGVPDQFPSFMHFPQGYKGNNVDSPLLPHVSSFKEGSFNYKQIDLVSWASQNGKVSNFLDAKYNPYLSKIAMVRGLDFPGRIDHNWGGVSMSGNVAGSHLTFLKPNLTMDQVLARSTAFYPNASDACPGPILSMGEYVISTARYNANDGTGVQVDSANARMSYLGNIQLAFDALFTPGVPIVSSRLNAIDRVLASVNKIKTDGKISSADKLKLDEYLQGLSQLKQCRSIQPTAVTCAKPSTSFLNFSTRDQYGGSKYLSVDTTTVQSYYSDLAKLIVLAIKCDLARVFNVGISSSIESAAFAANHQTENGKWHGDYGHSSNYDQLFILHKWVFDTLVYKLLTDLSVTELDNTLIYWAPEMSHGHSGINMNAILVGNKINGGKAYDYADYSIERIEHTGYGKGNPDRSVILGPGQPVNRLWVGIMNSLGVSSSAYFGKYGNMSNTFGNWKDFYSDGWESHFGDVLRSQYIGGKLPGLF